MKLHIKVISPLYYLILCLCDLRLITPSRVSKASTNDSVYVYCWMGTDCEYYNPMPVTMAKAM